MSDGLAFSPDGQVLAGAGFIDEKPVITLWDVASGHVIRRIGSLPNAPPRPLVFLPDGKVLFSCVSWWNPSRNMTADPGSQRKARSTSGMSPPARKSGASEWESRGSTRPFLLPMAKRWPRRQPTRRSGSGTWPRAGKSADSEEPTWRHATSRSHPTARNWRQQRPSGWTPPTSGRAPHHADPHLGHGHRPRAPPLGMDNGSQVCFSPDGTTLASVGRQVIRLWEVASGREIRPQSGGHHSEIGDAAFVPDGRSIVTVGHDRTIRFWDPDTGREIRQLERSDAGLEFVAFSADGKTMATGYGFQPTRLWDVASGRELRRFQLPGKPDDQFVSCADLSPDGKTLATSADDGVILWDTATGERRAGVAKSPLATKSPSSLKPCDSPRTVSPWPPSAATGSGSGTWPRPRKPAGL